jgi:KDEL-tailed cysteine endopeptidase
LLSLAAAAAGASEHATLLQRFESWLERHRIEEVSGMFRKWIDNDDYIHRVNDKNLSYTLGHNQYSGMDLADFRTAVLGGGLDSPMTSSSSSSSFLRKSTSSSWVMAHLPASVDWVQAGAVTPVKDQGQCGSCWSFSATGALEGAFFLTQGGKDVATSFSEQQLVDCDNRKNRQVPGKDSGCNGGLMDNAFDWIQRNGGLCTDAAYPYVSGTTKSTGECRTSSCSIVPGSQVTTFVDVAPSQESAFLSALTKQPVAVAIEADQRDFQLYKTGVFTGACGTKLDHGVLAVGYGTDDDSGIDYYLVKNSWSDSWGQDGYIRLGRGKDPNTGAVYNQGDGQCGILLSASYPVL